MIHVDRTPWRAANRMLGRRNRGARRKNERNGERRHPHQLEEAATRVGGDGESGTRSEKRFAAEEPSELRHDERRKQDRQRSEADRDVEPAQSHRKARRHARRSIVEQRAARPTGHNPGEEAREHDVLGDRVEVEGGNRDDARENRVGRAKQ
jgi:hypothetical protein